ncbi:amidohydrolase family protein [Thermodesulfobacteriota bacterium]
MEKRYEVIDAQFHYLPREACRMSEEIVSDAEEIKKLQARIKFPAFTPVYHKIYDIEKTIAHMEECGVDRILAGLATWNTAGHDICKAINNGLAELVKEHPGKFIPLAHVSILQDQAGVDELDRAINDLGLKGVTILTSEKDTRLDDRRLWPFYKKVMELHVPVVVHPTTKSPLWGGTKYFLSGSVSREYEIAKSFVEVLSGVLPEFPDLNFLFAHYGGGVPFLLGRIMSWHTPEQSGIPKDKISLPKTIREFEDYGLKEDFDRLLDRIYFDMAGTGGWMPAVSEALLAIKPERLCLGSDYPFEMSRPEDLKAYINGIKGLDIPETDKAKILGENIKALFKA